MTTTLAPNTSDGIDLSARLDRCRGLMELAARLAITHRFVPLSVTVDPARGHYPRVERDRLSIYVMDDDPADLNRVADALGFAPARPRRDDDTTVMRVGTLPATQCPGAPVSGIEVVLWCGIPDAARG